MPTEECSLVDKPKIVQDLQDACILNKNILLILEILLILYYLII